MSSKVICPGSYDPVTLGHHAIFEAAGSRFDEIIIAIGKNTDKKTFFSLDERLDMLDRSATLIKERNPHFGAFTVTHYENLLVDFAKDHDVQTILRGMRPSLDFAPEMEMALVNKKIEPTIETLFIPSPQELSLVRSSTVRELAQFPGWEKRVKRIVPKHVYVKFLEKKYFSKWNELCKSLNLNIKEYKIHEAYKKITSLIRDNHYHDMSHVASMYVLFNEIKHMFINPELAELFIWLHDLKHKSLLETIEEKNMIMRELSFPLKLSNELSNYILKSNHSEETDDPDLQLLLDIDLSILGASKEEFDLFDRVEIPQEYKEFEGLPFIHGRLCVMEAFKSKEPIYRTKYFEDKYEIQAQENVSRSVSYWERKKNLLLSK